jgi:hypothetical protein
MLYPCPQRKVPRTLAIEPERGYPTAAPPRNASMCPFCLSAAAAWAIAAATASTGGLTALLVARRHDHTEHRPEPTTEDTSR